MTLSGSKECDIKKPIWYLDSRCSRHMTGVKSYLYKFVEQPGPKVVFGDDSTYITDGLFDEKRGIILNSNKEVVMIALRRNYAQHVKMESITRSINHEKYTLVIIVEYSRAFIVLNTRRQQIEETFHITFDESTNAITFSKPLVEDTIIAEFERYPTDEYLHHFKPLQMDKDIKLVNIVGNPGAGMLIRKMAKELSAALADKCFFVDFLSKEEPKMFFEALKHLG
ncbi:hypothetical protein Tco_0168522 [Tanacetum coccineum]